MLLADSLGVKSSAPSAGGTEGQLKAPVTAPKVVHVAPCAYAVHAGTWQPALEMLTRLRVMILEGGWSPQWGECCVAMSAIGHDVYGHYRKVFGLDSFDVRVALVLTGDLRHADDRSAGRSSSIVLWEVARNFEPVHVVGHLHFGGDASLSKLATTVLGQDVLSNMASQGPLPCAQALLATHALLARLSTHIGTDANVVVCGSDTEHTVIHGTMVSLPQGAMLKG